MRKNKLNKESKVKNRGFFSRESIKDSLNYIGDSRNYIYFGIGVFVLFALICFIFPDQISKIFELITGMDINDYLRNIMSQADQKEGLALLGFIFLNNLSVATISMFNFVLLLQIVNSTSVLQAIALIIFFPIYSLFGILPTFFAIVNGGILGYVFARVYEVSGVSDFWMILPHGIFELPAIFISIGLGIKNGLFFVSKNPLSEFKIRFYNSFKVLIFVIIPLLLVAASIESFLILFF